MQQHHHTSVVLANPRSTPASPHDLYTTMWIVRLYLVMIPLAFKSCVSATCDDQTRIALSQFYVSTNGPNWLTRTNWMNYGISPCSSSSSNSHQTKTKRAFTDIYMVWSLELLFIIFSFLKKKLFIDWYRVYSSNNAVVELRLENNFLSGTIPSEIRYITALSRLQIDRNYNLGGMCC
jgi:hypothetical protein